MAYGLSFLTQPFFKSHGIYKILTMILPLTASCMHKTTALLSKYGVFSVLKLQHWPMIHIAKALECILHNLDTSFRFEPQENHLQHKSKTILDSYARLKPLQLGAPSRTFEGHTSNGKTWQIARCLAVQVCTVGTLGP